MTVPAAASSAYSSSGQAYWYLTRSTGAVALVLLTIVVVLGLLGPMRLSLSSRWPRFAVGTLHRDLSLLVLVVLAIHIVTTVLDGFAPIGWLDAVIPFRSPYRPLWLGFGALALDLLIAIVLTSLIRLRLGFQRWRAIHWLSYLSWPVAVVHGLGTGSDPKQAWMLALVVICTAGVVGAAAARVAREQRIAVRARAAGVALALATPLGIAVFAVLGPLAPHWSQRAGTPVSLLHEATVRKVSQARPVAPAVTFSARVDGSLRRTRARGGALVDVRLAVHGQPREVLRIRMAGGALSGGGLSLVGSQVDFSDPTLGAVLGGAVTSLAGTEIQAHVTGAGHALRLYVVLRLRPASDHVSGSLRVTNA